MLRYARLHVAWPWVGPQPAGRLGNCGNIRRRIMYARVATVVKAGRPVAASAAGRTVLVRPRPRPVRGSET
eukprot:SAG31_NODE_619_length_13509_cov_3.297539_8_plen_71_part_00